MRLEKGTGIVGIEASCLRIYGHSFHYRPAERRKGYREPFRLTHRGLIDAEAPASGFRVMRLDPRTFFFSPVHRTNVERGIFGEACNALARELDPGFSGYDRFEEHSLGRFIDPCTMEFQVWCDPFERPRAIKHDRTEPRRVCAGAHDGYAALLPSVFEISPS